MVHRKTLEFALTSALVAMLAVGCHGDDGSSETATHFMTTCDTECSAGLSCVCGVCTAACSTDQRCLDLDAEARCAPTGGECAGNVTSVCGVECTQAADCARFSPSLECVSGRCASGESPGSGGAGQGGSNGGGGNGGGGGITPAGGSGGAGSGCSTVGATCCDPFPGDGPNYCEDGLVCSAGNQCSVDSCDCALGAYIPACGVDGVTYDATCGRQCVPVDIQCDGECPCTCGGEQSTGCSPATGTGTPCCGGLQCCQGVPYDQQGECHAECNLISDRGAKTDVRIADPDALLQSVARLPMSTWRYRSEPEARHVGPMAQDFAAEFQLGSDDRVIAAVDASGVALASIQALHRHVEQLTRENEDLRSRLELLERRQPRVADEP